jgi:hypothetical protein
MGEPLQSHQGIIAFFRHEDIVRIFNLATKNLNDHNKF